MKLHETSTSTQSIKAFKGLEDSFNITHANKYDYSSTVFKSAKDPLEILCSTHGMFLQRAADHKRGQGCPKCAHKILTKSTEQFVLKAEEVHKHKYDYSLVKYTGAHKPVTIKCVLHGIFTQTPHNHLQNHGCYECGRKSTEESLKSSTDVFITKAISVHKDKYDYTSTEYTYSAESVQIVCKHHGVFTQRAADHLRGCGCPKCGRLNQRGRYLSEPTILYYLKMQTEVGVLFKVGITLSRIGIAGRYRGSSIPYEVLQQCEFKTGKEAFQIEQQLLAENMHSRYYGMKVIPDGNTELFITDILKEYNDKIEQYIKNESNR